MGQGVKFGTNSKDTFVRIFRVKADHSMILIPKADGDTEFTGIADAEFASEIVGPINLVANADGSHSVDFVCAAYGEELLDFIANYKPVGASGETTPFLAFHGEEFGGGGAAASDDALLVVVHGPDDADTGKIMAKAFLSTLDPTSGGSSIDPKKTIDTTLKFIQIKATADITIHDAAGSKSVLNPAIVDFTTESSDIDLLEGNYKYHFPVTAV